jgi:hypothetical protein
MRTFLLAASAAMLVSCATPEMTTVAANAGPQQAFGQYEPPPPPQLTRPPRRGWASNYRSTPR